MFRRLLLYLPFLLISTDMLSQGSPFNFHHLKEKDGLSDNLVNSFLKDSKGRFWVGTFDGLNRFDGSHFYVYKMTKNANSIINNSVHDLCEDKQNRIWGVTDNGIFCLDPQTDKFRNYDPPNSSLSPSPINIGRAGFNILCDRNGDIWATGVWTLLRYNKTKDRFEEVGPLAPSTDSLGFYSVRKNALIEDPAGNGIWMGVRRGLQFYDFKSGRFINYKNDFSPIFNDHSISALHANKKGEIWFFDNTILEICCFNPLTKKIIRRISMLNDMPNARGATLFEDSEQRLWFSSWTNEIAVIDLRNNNTFSFVRNAKSDPLSVAADFFWCATEDKDGTLWLGTLGGISRCNTIKSLYRIHQLGEKFPFLKGNSIRLISEDPSDRSWWLITRNKLYAINYFPLTGQYIVYDLDKQKKNKAGQTPGPVYSILYIKGKPVLATHNGPWQIERDHQEIIPFEFPENVVKDYVVRNMVEKDGIYFLNDGKVVIKYNSLSGEVKRIRYPHELLPDGQPHIVGGITLAPDRRVWFGMALGWAGYIDDSDEIKPLKIMKEFAVEAGGYFSGVAADRHSNVWFAVKGSGLYRVNPKTNESKFWNESDGLGYNHIMATLPDNDGNIWSACYNKFTIFTPSSESFYNFNLPLNENKLDYDNAFALLSNGNMLSSSQNDIIEFFPQRLKLRPAIQAPNIGSIKVEGVEKFHKGLSSLVLKADERSLLVKFGMLTDPETFPYSFEYKLDGIDDRWITSGPENQAVYNKLPSGNYTFRLVAKARNGSWITPERIIKIHIKTPFFKSIWFYILAAATTALLIYLFYSFRTRKQRQLVELTTKAQMLEKEKALVMYENLKQHLNPHFLFNSLTSLGSLIRINQGMAGDFLDKMSKVYRYILKNRDNEVVPLGEELKFVQLYIDLQKTRFEEGLIVSVDVDEEHYHRKIAPVTLQNLVENAIKHNTSEPGSPLRIELFVEDDCLVVRNNLQRKSFVETSNKQGLSNMESLYHYLSNRPMEIIEDGQYFTVKIPLL